MDCGEQKEYSFYCWFIEKHLDNVDWGGLSGNANIPLEFFEKHLDRLNWVIFHGIPLS